VWTPGRRPSVLGDVIAVVLCLTLIVVLIIAVVSK
jgi:hypothetical protein